MEVRRHTRGFGLLLPIFLAVALSLPAATHASARLSIAPNANVLLPELYPENMRLLQDLDPHSVMTYVPWKAVQPCEPGTGCKPEYEWGYVDTRVKWLADRGLKPDVLLSHAPKWATNGDCDYPGACYPRRSHYGDWRKFVRSAVERYGPEGTFWERNGYAPRYEVRTWESWHEPNVPHFWESDPDVGQYFRVFKHFSRAVRSAHPDARVMIGSFTFTDRATRRYVEDLFENHDVEGRFDSVAVHPYAPTAGRVLKRISRFHEITDSDRIWVDEIGWNTASREKNEFTVTPRGQARRFRRLIDRTRASRSYVKQISAFSLLDLDSDGTATGSASTYGLALDRDHGFAPKPAYHVIKARTH